MKERDQYEKLARDVISNEKDNIELISDLVLTLHEDKIASPRIYEMCLDSFDTIDKSSPGYTYFRTAYAVCLFHIGKIADSKKILEEVIGTARTTGQDASYAEAVLADIKNR